MEDIQIRLECREIASPTHLGALDRLNLATETLGDLSGDGKLVFERICSGVERVEQALASKDLKHYLRNAHLLTNERIIRP